MGKRIRRINPDIAIEAINEAFAIMSDDVDDLAKLYSFIYNRSVIVTNDCGGSDSDVFYRGKRIK